LQNSYGISLAFGQVIQRGKHHLLGMAQRDEHKQQEQTDYKFFHTIQT